MQGRYNTALVFCCYLLLLIFLLTITVRFNNLILLSFKINKKVTVSLWKLIAFITFTIGFITLGIATENIVVSKNVVDVAKIITIIVVGTIAVVNIGKILLDKIDFIKEFVTNQINYIIVSLFIILIANLVFGIVHQINIGAMSESVLKTIAIVGVIIVSVIFIMSSTNIIKLSIAHKEMKKKTRMRKLASLIVKSSKAVNSNNTIKIQALVTDLFSLSVQDIVINDNTINVKKLYKSEIFMSLINDTTAVSQELGSFKNSFNTLVSNNYISSLEAATAKVVTFNVNREVLELL